MFGTLYLCFRKDLFTLQDILNLFNRIRKWKKTFLLMIPQRLQKEYVSNKRALLWHYYLYFEKGHKFHILVCLHSYMSFRKQCWIRITSTKTYFIKATLWMDDVISVLNHFITHLLNNMFCVMMHKYKNKINVSNEK